MSETARPSIRILLVDSDRQAREAVEDCLLAEDEQFDVRTAGTLSAAAELLDDVDCVVTDGKLADGSGIELLRAVGEIDPWLPVVLYPSDGDEALAAEAVAEGVDAYRPRGTVTESCGAVAADVREVVERHAQRRATLDRMTDAFFALNTSWEFTYLNDEGRRVISDASGTAYATDALLGESIWDVITGLGETTFGERYREAMASQEPVCFEAYYDRLERWYEVRVFPSATGLSVYFQDITERKADERELERREEVLTEMYRVVADKDRSFEEKVRRLLDIGREELATEYGSLSRVDDDEYVFEIVACPPDDDAIADGDRVPLSWTSCERAVTTEETLVIADMEADAPELAGRQGNVALGLEQYLGAPVIVDEEVTGTFCFYSKQAREEPFSRWEVTLVELMGNWISYEREQKRNRAELARERNRMEEFASMVSHDLRSPLSAAIARLELVRDDCDSEHVEELGAALDRMEELIEDVLALARLGQQVVETHPVDFETVVREAWGTAGGEDATLVVDGGETVVGDDSRLRQLLENLFRNAVEHGSTDSDSQARQSSVEHGSTSNRTASDDAAEHGGENDDVTVHVGLLDDGAGFYVADDGPGIPAEDREQVFESGYTTERDGTGFGLNIVEQVVAAHGGEVTLTESEDGGARFEIRGIETR
jgi:signal transduction histidine kinase/CheY-like chemotaxis protein